MTRILDHFYLFGAISLAIYSQCIIRWRLGFEPDIPSGIALKINFVMKFLIQPWVMSSVLATFISGVLWILALTRFDLNYAYPWMAMIFIVMSFLGAILFGESLNAYKIIGTMMVTFGLILVARS